MMQLKRGHSKSNKHHQMLLRISNGVSHITKIQWQENMIHIMKIRAKFGQRIKMHEAKAFE